MRGWRVVVAGAAGVATAGADTVVVVVVLVVALVVLLVLLNVVFLHVGPVVVAILVVLKRGLLEREPRRLVFWMSCFFAGGKVALKAFRDRRDAPERVRWRVSVKF
jgi:hypothetical protein